MNEKDLSLLIDNLLEGRMDKDQFVSKLKTAPFQDLGEVKLDHHRALRKGFAEIVYCPGKSDEQLVNIAQAVAPRDETYLFSRISPQQVELIRPILPGICYHEKARTAGVNRKEEPFIEGMTVIAAGSSDIPVAEEAAVVGEYMGCKVVRLFDVGVAGIHRLLANVETLMNSKVIVAVAGMEGALPGVVAGIVGCPVIAVPTSVGYGANFNGLSALLTMINSCATGITVVNIDNGLGAGFTAGLITRQSK